MLIGKIVKGCRGIFRCRAREERLSTKSDWLKILHLSFDRFRLCIGSIAKCTKQKKIDNTKMITVTADSRQPKLGLAFSVIFFSQVSSSEFGNLQSIELLPNGENIFVTNSNREQFVSLYVNHLLVKCVERQFGAFSRGFHKVCNFLGDKKSFFVVKKVKPA